MNTAKKNLTPIDYQTFFDNPYGLFCIISESGEINLLSPYWATLLGWDLPELYQKNITALMPPEDIEMTGIALPGRKLEAETIRLLDYRGNVIWLEWNAKLIDGRYYVTAHDVSHQVKLEKELKQHHIQLEELVIERTKSYETANQALKIEVMERKILEDHLRHAKAVADNANKAKSQFLANMSHELRTPMNAILGFTHLLQQENNVAKLQQYSAIIERSGRHLIQIIDDMLDLSNIEADKIELKAEPFDILKSIQDVIDITFNKINQEQVTFNVRLDENLNDIYIGDAFRIRQMLTNLLGNAAKFTHAGSVTLDIYVLQKEHEQSQLAFTVSDTGIGIKRDFISKVFLPFTQEDETTTRKYGGTGLGLSLAIKIAKVMRGDIKVESKEAKGTTFSATIYLQNAAQAKTVKSLNHCISEDQFTLLRTRPPLTPPAQPITPANASPTTPRKKANTTSDKPDQKFHILLVEDEAVNQMLMKMLLENWCYTVEVAYNGAEALKKLTSQSFDLILMDIQMPIMDGYEATEKIRLQNNLTPIIALTGHAMQEHRERGLKAGMNDVVTKPINEADLHQKIQKFLGQ